MKNKKPSPRRMEMVYVKSYALNRR